MRRVLLVDGGTGTLEDVKAFLIERGYGAELIDDEEAILETCEAFKPHAIVADIDWAIEGILAPEFVVLMNRSFPAIPIITLSSHWHERASRRLDGLCSVYNLAKPFDTAVLLKLIDLTIDMARPQAVRTAALVPFEYETSGMRS